MSEPAAVPTVGRRAPNRFQRVASVWFRHYLVYSDTFIANATPAVLEPLLLLLAVGLGVGQFIQKSFLGLHFAAFMAPGLLGMTSAYTAAFEATYGTFVRLRYQLTYDAMRATPLTVPDIFMGELLWCASKGLLFSTIVGLVVLCFGYVATPAALLIPIVGFFAAMAIGGISFFVTSLVKNMNHFQFFFTVGLTPLIFFSGLMFPVTYLPGALTKVAYVSPMYHVIETFRLVVSGPAHTTNAYAWISPIVLVLMALAFGALGVRRMTRRLVG